MTPTINTKVSDIIAETITVKTKMLSQSVYQIERCVVKLAQVAVSGGRILFCGNGGSAADSQHLAAELVVRLRAKINRPAIPAMALTVDTSILTAGGNDIGFENIFSRQVEAYGTENDALVAISTSGNSENIVRAVATAKAKGMLTIGLLGGSGGKLLKMCDDSVVVPSDVTARIQEEHIMIGHIWCEVIEESMFPEFIK